MTVPAYPVPNPAAPSRPATVTISSALIFVVVAMQLLSAIVVISISGTLAETYQEVMEQESTQAAADIGPVIRFAYIFMAVVYVLIAIGMATLAFLNNRGKNASRILTWVFGGLGLCCNSAALSLTAAGNVAFTGNTGDEAAVNEAVAAAIPGWVNTIQMIVVVVTVLGLLGAIVLLALPPSNAWFRQPPAWNPAMPFQPYPGQPVYPQQPGYPQQPVYPQQPGQPGQYAQPGYPAPPSHFGAPQQYGQPGEPAPGLSPYPPTTPGQVPPYPSAPPGQPDPWAPQPSSPQSPPQSSSEPASDPWAAPPAGESPAAGPASGGDQGGDPPPKSSSDPS